MARRGGRKKPPSRRGGDGGGSGGDGGKGRRVPYEEKFAEFIRLCEEKKGQVEVVFVDHPEVIGDDFAEIVESLGRLADAGLGLRVVNRSSRRPPDSAPPPTPGSDGDRPVRLPRPTVSVPENEDDPRKFGEAGIKGMVINPIYAGVGEFPRMVPEAQWVGAARRVLAEDGPDQFLVNLLYVLRRTFGCVEWGGNLSPDAN